MTFDSCFVVRNMKIIESEKGLILCMPTRKMPDGQFKDIAHPITAEFRGKLEKEVFARFQEERLKAASGAGAGSQVV